MRISKLLLAVFIVCSVVISTHIKPVSSTDVDDDAERWKRKDVRDYTDADLERLLDQWEENDEDELEPDELPEWKRPQPKVDMSRLDPNDPEAMLQMTKKDRTLMMFASVSGNPTEKETQEISQIWQGSLFNAHMETQRYVVGSNRVLFVLKDGSKAWEVKKYLIEQERCHSVSIEGKDYYGKGYTGEESESTGSYSQEDKKKKGGKKSSNKANSKTEL